MYQNILKNQYIFNNINLNKFYKNQYLYNNKYINVNYIYNNNNNNNNNNNDILYDFNKKYYLSYLIRKILQSVFIIFTILLIKKWFKVVWKKFIQVLQLMHSIYT